MHRLFHRNGWAQAIAQLRRQHQPDEFVAVFDGPGHTWRHELLPTYKSSRGLAPVVKLRVAEERLSEKDVDATTAAVEELLKASGTPLPAKVVLGLYRMAHRRSSQGKLEQDYAKLDEVHRKAEFETLLRDVMLEVADPIATAMLTQLEASERLDERLDQVVELLFRAESERARQGARTRTSDPSEPLHEGPGGVPILPVKDFAGRVTELDELGRKLADHETVCVVATGLGGIGKTSLAQQFVATRKAKFPDGSAWLDARRLTEDLERVCRRFGWSDERAPTPEHAVRFLARVLHERSFLLVVDNVAEDLPLDHVPCPGGRCHTLVTSRARHIHADLDAVPLNLGVWSIKEALGYLRARCERLRGCSDAELGPLVEFVGWLPLGVKLLAALLVRRSLAPAAALAELRAQSVGLLEKHRGQNPGLVATFQATYDELDERSRRVLQSMAVCARRTRAVVVGHVSGVENVYEVLDDLFARSLIEREDDQIWKLHDVVRLFVRAQPGIEQLEAAHLEWVEARFVTHADTLDRIAFSEGVDEGQEALRRLVEVRNFERTMLLYQPLEGHLRRADSYPRAIAVTNMLLQSVEPDSAWAGTCRENLDRCLEELFSLYHGKLIAYAHRSGYSAEAEELAQIAFIELFTAVSLDTDPTVSTGAYLFTVVRNRAIKLGVRQARKELAADTPGLEHEDPEPSALEQFLARHDHQRLITLLESHCNPAQQTVLAMTHAGATTEEIAAALETTVGKVRVIRHRALAKLRAAIDETPA